MIFATAIPVELWVGGSITLVITAAASFAAGTAYARQSLFRAADKARKQLSKLYPMVVERIDAAQEACGLLEGFPGLRLSTAQSQRLDQKRNRLMETVAKIIDAQAALAPPPSPKPQEPISINWVRSPEDSLTGLPDRTAFESNLVSLLESGNQSQTANGLLLIKVDRFDRLKQRYGARNAERLFKKMATVVCRVLRDEDLVCRYSNETFGVLMPGVDAESGRQRAAGIRKAVRHHHFRLDQGAPEVLVTASFGFTLCPPDDHVDVDLALNRAGDALAKSFKRGRNQLYVHDGNSLLYCRAV